MDFIQIKKGLLHGLLTPDRFLLTGAIEAKTCIEGYRVSLPFIDLYKDGTLVLHHGYSWDGASGPTWDTWTTMRASAIHDALYKLIKMGYVPKKTKWKSDLMLYFIMREDGAWWIRALYYMIAVEVFGNSHL